MKNSINLDILSKSLGCSPAVLANSLKTLRIRLSRVENKSVALRLNETNISEILGGAFQVRVLRTLLLAKIRPSSV